MRLGPGSISWGKSENLPAIEAENSKSTEVHQGIVALLTRSSDSPVGYVLSHLDPCHSRERVAGRRGAASRAAPET